MARVTKAKTAKAKHKKILSASKGYYGARSRLYKTAKQANIKALQYSFRDRKAKKRVFRSLWISRINAAAKNLDTSYSKLIPALKSKDININRKMLSEIATNDPHAFEKIVKTALK